MVDDEESRRFTDNLVEITSAFHENVNTNEATARLPLWLRQSLMLDRNI